MNNKLLLATIMLILFTTVFMTVANAKNLNLFCIKKQQITVTLKNDANIDKSKAKILEIPQIKITNIKYRDQEWSKMVNKYDLPNIENPFKNEFVIKISKNANINEIYNQIKALDFVEKVEYNSNTECSGKY